MIWVNFVISEQKMDFTNDFARFKKSKSFESIFRIQKSIEIASIFKECVDTRSLLFERLFALNRKYCGHGTFQKIQTMQHHGPDIKDASILRCIFRLWNSSCGDCAPYSPHLLRRIIALWRPGSNGNLLKAISQDQTPFNLSKIRIRIYINLGDELL